MQIIFQNYAVYFQNGSSSTPLFRFYIKNSLQPEKIYHFVQYSPQKCFNKFFQSVVDARWEEDERPFMRSCGRDYETF